MTNRERERCLTPAAKEVRYVGSEIWQRQMRWEPRADTAARFGRGIENDDLSSIGENEPDTGDAVVQVPARLHSKLRLAFVESSDLDGQHRRHAAVTRHLSGRGSG
jgi:hypothetical protein